MSDQVLSEHVDGRDHLLSPMSDKLFTLGCDWIVKQWVGRKVSFKILPKEIGRNEGFIIQATIFNQTRRVMRYYAKVQPREISDVWVHYLLKYMNCGPEEFLIIPLAKSENYFTGQGLKLGIITQEIENFTTMKHYRTRKNIDEELWQADSFFLAFAASIGQFGNIPRNRDNWGFSQPTRSPARMYLVDFLSFGYSSGRKTSLETLWANTRKLGPQPRTTLLSGTHDDSFTVPVASLKKHFKFFHSQANFLDLLQRVCKSTDDWLNCHYKGAEGASLSLCTSRFLKMSPYFQVQCTPSQDHSWEALTAIDQYKTWIVHLGSYLQTLFTWFPFAGKKWTPSRSARHWPAKKVVVNLDKVVAHTGQTTATTTTSVNTTSTGRVSAVKAKRSAKHSSTNVISGRTRSSSQRVMVITRSKLTPLTAR